MIFRKTDHRINMQAVGNNQQQLGRILFSRFSNEPPVQSSTSSSTVQMMATSPTATLPYKRIAGAESQRRIGDSRRQLLIKRLQSLLFKRQIAVESPGRDLEKRASVDAAWLRQAYQNARVEKTVTPESPPALQSSTPRLSDTAAHTDELFDSSPLDGKNARVRKHLGRAWRVLRRVDKKDKRLIQQLATIIQPVVQPIMQPNLLPVAPTPRVRGSAPPHSRAAPNMRCHPPAFPLRVTVTPKDPV